MQTYSLQIIRILACVMCACVMCHVCMHAGGFRDGEPPRTHLPLLHDPAYQRAAGGGLQRDETVRHTGTVICTLYYHMSCSKLVVDI